MHFFFFACFRDLLLPDGNRVSAFSVASTAIAAAQWSSSQVGSFSVIYHLCPYHQCNKFITHSLPFQPQQSSEGMSEYSYMQEGYPPLSQVSKTIKADKGWGDSLTINVIHYRNLLLCITCVCASQWTMAAPHRLPWRARCSWKTSPAIINQSMPLN